MKKTAEIELAQLKTAVHYLVGLLAEGSLLDRFDEGMREELAVVLDLLIQKVEGLPAGIPENLVQATAVRAIVDAAEKFSDTDHDVRQASLSRNMQEAEVAASIQGHTLGKWEKVEGSDMEFQATCSGCGGFVYVSHMDSYNLLLDDCERT